MPMDEWRFYARRIVSGEWLDNDVQLSDISITKALSTPNSGQAVLVAPDVEPLGSDGRPVWGKWDTMLYCERNGGLDSVYIADSVQPSATGPQISLIGAAGWLARVDYSGVYQVWETNTFDVVRELLSHANGKPRGLNFVYPATMSATTVGSPNPPAKPVKPPRHKGESKSDYQSSTRYTNWQNDLSDWTDAYGQNEKYKVVYWESPYILDEISQLADETGFDWREKYQWTAPLTPEFKIQFDDNLIRDRSDIVIEDGVNVLGRLFPSDADESYANKVLAIGAGQGRNTRKETSTYDDGRLYAARYLNRKAIRHSKKLQRQADAAVKRWRKIDPQIGAVNIVNTAGFSDVNTIQPGDRVQVKSTFVSPHLNTSCIVKSVTEYPLMGDRIQVEFDTEAA